jgi:arylsulfatase A-like enzyme
MLSRRPGNTGVYGLEPWFRDVKELRDLVSLPQAFKRAGYRTATAGKVYHQFPPSPDRAAEFDTYGPACNFGPLPEKKMVKTPSDMRLVDWGVFPERDHQQNDWQIASWAEDFLAARGTADDDPFFLAVGFGRPHLPCFASQQWFDLYPEESLAMPPVRDDDRADTPDFSWYLHWQLPEPRLSWLRNAGQWRPLVRAYLASTSFVDSQVGRVIDALDRSGKADETIIVLWSDHGWHLGEKGISGKNSLWERSTRVPLMLAGPGIPAGTRCGEPAELLDIYPTLTALCRIEAPAGLEGLSLMPQLADSGKPRRPAVTTHNPGNHAVRDRHHRYIRYADGSEELYDHRSDPNEWHNLASRPESAETIKRLAAFLPKDDKPPVPGSAGRILVRGSGGSWIWEGKPVAWELLSR